MKELRRVVLARGTGLTGVHDIIEKEDLVDRALKVLQPAPEEPILHSHLGAMCARKVGTDDRMEEAQRSSVVRLPKLLSAEDIRSVHALASQVGDVGRSTKDGSRSSSGPWNTIYLHTGGAFGSHLPELQSRLIRAAREVDASQPCWGLLPPHVAVRVAEYHTVQTHGSLPWCSSGIELAAFGHSCSLPSPLDLSMHLTTRLSNPIRDRRARHFDEGSLLTIDCMLSDPSRDFTGGTFQTLEPSGELAPHTFLHGDVQIFQSHKYHCVSPVSSGMRRVLVIELWDGAERRCAHRCEQRTGKCPLEPASSFTMED